MRSALALILFASPLAAQDLSYSNDHTLNCINQASEPEGRRGCIGTSARVCIKMSGGSTIEMSGCLDQERDLWDYALNENYRQAIEKAQRFDAENTHSKVEPPLREMQRAWIAFRDARCDFEMAQWGGGTGGSPAVTGCLMQATGEQALYLYESWLEQGK